MENTWVEISRDIREIVNKEMKVQIKWTKKPEIDYLNLSRQYMNAGFIVLKDVIEGEHNNNIKYDMWFMPGVYMIRQAIELLVKAGLAIKGASKQELQEIFLVKKHNIRALYNVFKKKYGVEELNEHERIWIESYLDSVEMIDANSDLFRYPFKDQFMQQFGDESLDVWHMGTRLMHCYSVLNKMIFGVWFENQEIELNEEPKFIDMAVSSMNNCMLWSSSWDSGFHRQIIGYSEVAKFLFDEFNETKKVELFYPIAFLMRNAIEIALKRLLHMNMEEGVDEGLIIANRNSHKLYKDLWKSVKPMLLYYSQEDNQEVGTLDIVESYIIALDNIDKQGDVFRYPSSYSHEYKFNDEEIDVENFFTYLLALFNAVDSFDAWLYSIKDIEMEMRSEWEAELRSSVDYYDYQI